MEKMELNELVRSAYVDWTENTFAPYGVGDGPIWEEPFLGFAAGDDPLWTAYKEVIGPFHWTPEELWALARPDEEVPPGELTVLSLCFPQAVDTVREQQAAVQLPVPRWVFARNSWGAAIRPLCTELLARLAEAGVDAVAPDQMPQFGMVRGEKGELLARWSHRHVAFVAGLGTFGLSDGFITRRGMAVRFFTLVLRGKWTADPRPTEDPYGWCLYHRDGSCGACIVRCPAEAVGVEGHDSILCEARLGHNHDHYRDTPGFDPKVEAGCGICQAGVPCALCKPGRE